MFVSGLCFLNVEAQKLMSFASCFWVTLGLLNFVSDNFNNKEHLYSQSSENQYKFSDFDDGSILKQRTFTI